MNKNDLIGSLRKRGVRKDVYRFIGVGSEEKIEILSGRRMSYRIEAMKESDVDYIEFVFRFRELNDANI